MQESLGVQVNSANATEDQVARAAPRMPMIQVDMTAFDPWRIQPVRHHLADHPLLRPAALVELGRRLEAQDSIRTHSNDATAGTPFGDAPSMHPNQKSAQATLQSIRDANAWMSLLNVQLDPAYRELIGEVLDSIRPQIDTRDPGMCHRAGWIFVSSPNTVTPFHFDKEHNFILQISGHKRVYVWDHTDTVVASEHARDRFHHHHERKLLHWQDDFRDRAHVFDLQPGQGAYMPSTSPHMVENGDEPSITMSFTYYTDATRRDALVHKVHSMLRDIGITPSPVGHKPVIDAMIYNAVEGMVGARGILRSLAGKQAQTRHARFALVNA